MIVHGDETVVLIDARGGRTQAFVISEPSGGHEQTLARHGLGAVRVHGETRTVVPGPHRSRPGAGRAVRRWSFWMCCSSCTAGFTSATGGVGLPVRRAVPCRPYLPGVNPV